MGRASVVEINGRQYDALTGQLVGAVQKVAHHVKNQSKPTVIDGFLRSNKSKAKTQPESKKTEHKTQPEAKKLHRPMQRSRTLVRAAVKKPNADSEPIVRTRTLVPNYAREMRAKSAAKSTYIKRFGFLSSRNKSHSTVEEGEIVDGSRSVALRSSGTYAATATAPLPSFTAASHQQIENLLDQALTRADAHKKALRQNMASNPWLRLKMAPRWLCIGLAAVLLLSVGAFAAWRYVPQVSIKAASFRTNVSAKAPAYVPVGYKFEGPAKYQNGAVNVSYKSTSGNFAISQTPSNWDSTSLQANMLNGQQQVQTSQVNGNTVYIYGQRDNAAWVSNGTLYSLKNDSNLSTDQVLRIVQSF